MKWLVALASVLVLLIGLHEWAGSQPANTQPSKISQLPSAGTLNGTELFPCDQTNGGVLGTYQCTVQQIANFVGTGFSVTQGQILAALGYTPANRAGDTFTGKVNTLASSAAGAGFNLPPGAAPSAPTDGDCWTTSGGLFCRINGGTVGPYTTATGGTLTCSSLSDAQAGCSTPTGSSGAVIGLLSSSKTDSGDDNWTGPQRIGSKAVSGTYTVLSTDPYRINVDLSVGPASITLNTSPEADSCHVFKNYKRNAFTNRMTITAGAGATIEGAASQVFGATGNGASVVICYTASTTNWDAY
jgi:hypothetical protein